MSAAGDPRKTYLWVKTRKEVLRRDRGICAYCGGPANEVDHVVMLAHGGAPYDPRNLRACCRRCNAQRGNTKRARRKSRSVFRSGTVDNPARIANLSPSGRWPLLLGDYGRRAPE